MGRILVTAVTLLCFTGCTTLQALPDAQPTTIQQSVRAGDTVELERTDGTRMVLKVDSVGSDALEGTQGGQHTRVAYSDIRSLGTRSASVSNKTWTWIAVVLGIGAVIALVAGGGGSGGSGSGY